MTPEANYTEVAVVAEYELEIAVAIVIHVGVMVTPTCGMPHPGHVRQYPVKWPVSVGTGNLHSTQYGVYLTMNIP